MKRIILLTGILLAITTNVFAQVAKEGYTRVIFPGFSLVYFDADKATLIKLDQFRVLMKELAAMSVNIEDDEGRIMEHIKIAEVHTCHNDTNQPCGDDKRSIMEEGFKFDTTPEPKATPTPK